MALVATPGGLWFPQVPIGSGVSDVVDTLAAASRIIAHMGSLQIAGRAASKTISQAGGGKIYFQTGAITFANAGTSLSVGLQGVDTSTGIPVRPDLTYTTKRVLVGGTDTIAANTWQSFAMGTGTATLSHGDRVAIVFYMTTRGGADSVTTKVQEWGTLSLNTAWPATARSSNDGSTWSNTLGVDFPGPLIIEFDDGTLGALMGDPQAPMLHNAAGTTTETYTDATNPDERGMLFQLPWDCKVDAFTVRMHPASSTGDMTLKLYSDPLGTPTALATLTLNAEQWPDYVNNGGFMYLLSSEVALSKNTDYALALKATGAGNLVLSLWPLHDTAHRAFWPGGTNVRKGTRNGGSGAFTEESPAVTLYKMGVRISQLPDSPAGSATPVIGGTVAK